MELKFVEYGSEAYLAAAKLRYRLFYQPHGLDESIVQTGKDAQDCHVVIEQDSQVLAYGRLTQAGEQFSVYQMVVEPAWQGQGLGRWLLKTLVDVAEQRGAQSVHLNARVSQMGFYERQGFEPASEVFASVSTGVPHLKMERRLKTDAP